MSRPSAPKPLILSEEDFVALDEALDRESQQLWEIFSARKFYETEDITKFIGICTDVIKAFGPLSSPGSMNEKQKFILQIMGQIFQICKADEDFRGQFFNHKDPQILKAAIIQIAGTINQGLEPKDLDGPIRPIARAAYAIHQLTERQNTADLSTNSDELGTGSEKPKTAPLPELAAATERLPSNDDLGEEIRKIYKSSTKNLLVAFYGKERLLNNKFLFLRFDHDLNPRRFILPNKTEEFPNFPGIRLRCLSEEPGNYQYEFSISDPISAKQGIVQFRQFFKDLEKTTAEYVAEAEANIKLEEIIENLSTIRICGADGQLLRYGLYGERDLSSSAERPKYGFAHGNSRRFFLQKELREDFPQFPGIGLRAISLKAASKEFIYEFYITDSVIAQEVGLRDFEAFFRGQQKAIEAYELRAIENNLLKIQSLLLENLKPTNTLNLPLKPPLPKAHNQVKISTKETLLVDRIMEHTRAEYFKALTFERGPKDSIILGIRRDVALAPDVKALEEIIGEHKTYLELEAKEVAKAGAAEVELMALLARKKQTGTTASSRTKKDQLVQSKKPTLPPKATPTPEDVLHSKIIDDIVANIAAFLDKNKAILLRNLNISEEPLVPEISYDDTSKSLAITLRNIPQEPVIKPQTNYTVTFDEKSGSLKIAIDASKFPSIEEASNQLRGFIKSKIIRPEVALFPAPEVTTETTRKIKIKKPKSETKDDPSSIALPEQTSEEPGAASANQAKTELASDPAAEKRDVGTMTDSTTPKPISASGSLSVADSILHKTADLPIDADRFDGEISKCLQARRSARNFNPAIINYFPKELLELISKFNSSEQVRQPAIYGGFIYGKNPKDLDFQIVVSDDFFSGDQKKDQDALATLFSPGLLDISKFTLAPTTQPIWKCKIGKQTEITFIRESDHKANQNWTSDIDAWVFDLRSGNLCAQSSFVGHVESVKSLISEGLLDVRQLPRLAININANTDCFLRVIYGMLPTVLSLDDDRDKISALARTLKANLAYGQDHKKRFLSSKEQLLDFYGYPEVYNEESFTASIKDLRSKTLGAVGRFHDKHPMNEEERVLFNYSLAQFLKGLDAQIFAEQISQGESGVRGRSAPATATYYPLAHASTASSLVANTAHPTTSPASAEAQSVGPGKIFSAEVGRG